MKRSELLRELTSRIIHVRQTHPTRVAIDGPDAAGKTFLAQELAEQLQAHGRTIIRSSIDGFHNPASIRYKRGKTSPDGYYHDSFNYDALSRFLLVPLGPGGSRQYRKAVFDYRTNSESQSITESADMDAILLFDGVFLLRSEVLQYWDFSIFVDAKFEVTLARAEKRDANLFGGVEEVRRRYQRRYIPGQKLYFDECGPKERATVVVDNNNASKPQMSKTAPSI